MKGGNNNDVFNAKKKCCFVGGEGYRLTELSKMRSDAHVS